MPSRQRSVGSDNDGPTDLVTDLLERFGNGAHTSTVFGKAIKHNGTEVIPVGSVSRRVRQQGTDRQGVSADMQVSPVGFIDFTEHGARFQPVRPWWVTFTYVMSASTLALVWLLRRRR